MERDGTAPAPPGIDERVRAIVADRELLLADDTITWAVRLSDLECARLRAKLREAKIQIGDFAAEVRRRRKACEKHPAARAVEQGEREALRVDRDGYPKGSLYNLKIILAHAFGDRLAFDEMSNIATLDGRQIDDATITGLRMDIEEREDIEFSRSTTEDALIYLARRNAFHPVRDYLRGLTWDSKRRLAHVADEYLGAGDGLSSKLVTRFFIAAVARACAPGCKFDNALVLVGDEMRKKSTFFRVLGGAHFRDSKVDITDRKGMMTMHSAWLYEWPEVDRMLERKHDSDVKAFVTQQDDSFVPMYGRAVITVPRSNVVGGTTNKEKFITSDTGSRRWWAVSVRKRIDTERLARERDQLWAEAVTLYDAYVEEEARGERTGDANPYRWWLTEDEEQGRAERNEEHLAASPDAEIVDAWLQGAAIPCARCQGTGKGTGHDQAGTAHPCPHCDGRKTVVRGELPMHTDTGRAYVTQAMILDGPLGVPAERRQANAARCASVLRRLGWRSGRRIVPPGGAKVVPYYSPVENGEADEREAIMGEPQAAAYDTVGVQTI